MFGYRTRFIVSFVLFAVVAQAEEALPPKESLFAPQRAQLEAAQKDQTAILAPTAFAQAKLALDDAEKDYDKARSLDKIREKISASAASLSQAFKLAQTARTVLATPLKARDDAEAAQAAKYATEAWKRATERF